ncbi:DUF1127 domain-containing protein [Rhizobium sp. C1]|uniref:DUF1127 domain-containing protein n=1 Tax=Rhizobium sp. C1 TaxID=1349799 RepID=UPI001E5FE08A|nr:DUF1127 domain-containing protein [Rhizobium sp. C1]MCD2176670.1 DUF1127 domain-containing protein [Rhizobium sp. C1]
MFELQLKDARELSLALDVIHRKFGFWTTFRALLATEMQRRRNMRELAFLDNRTRRDIGLPEIEVEPHIFWPFRRWDDRL